MDNFKVISIDKEYFTVVNLKTGEITSNRIVNFEHEELISKKAIEAKKNYSEKKTNRLKDVRGAFCMFDLMNNKKLKLKMTDRALLIILSLYINYDNVLSKKNGKALTLEEIRRFWQVYNRNEKRGSISAGKVSERLSRLTKTGVLISCKDKHDARKRNYIFERNYLMQGTRKTRDSFVKVYKYHLRLVMKNIQKIEKDANRERSKNKVNINKVLGLLHVIIPFVHYQTNYLVKNPDENILITKDEPIENALRRNPKKLKRLPYTWISQQLCYKEMNRKHLRENLQILVKADALRRDNNKNMYMVHPYLMYRQDTDEKLNLLLHKFNALK